MLRVVSVFLLKSFIRRVSTWLHFQEKVTRAEKRLRRHFLRILRLESFCMLLWHALGRKLFNKKRAAAVVYATGLLRCGCCLNFAVYSQS